MNPAKAEHDRPLLTESRIVFLFALVALVLWTGLLRYQDPVGEKYFPLMEPGAADFSVIFDGTKVFLDGNNPYYYFDAHSLDRWGRGDIVNGRKFRVSYPPSHFLWFIPFTLFSNDNREAGRMMFTFSVGLYLLIAALTTLLVARVLPATDRGKRAFLLLLAPVFTMLLAGNIGSALSLCRAQSDVITAALSWSAVLLFLRGKRFWPVFLLITASSGKGYAAVLGIGLFLLGLRRGGYKAELPAAALGLVFWLWPVRAYLHDGFIGAIAHASGFFTSIYFNHSFLNTFLHVSRGLASPGRLAMGGLTLLVAAGAWWHARKAMDRDDVPMSTLWVGIFATAALMLPIGMSTLSYIYNQILILPGVLLMFSVGDRLWEACGLPSSTTRSLFVLECVAGFLLFKYTLPYVAAPLAGFGNIAIVILLAVAVASGFLKTRRPMPILAAELATDVTRSP